MIDWIKHLSKPQQLIIGLAVALLLLVGMTLLLTQTAAQPAIAPNHYAEAKKTPLAGACLEEDPAITLSADDRFTVELAAMSHLIDVPAGTNVDVKIASYSADAVTGSDRYPAEYGNYNFVMTKQSGDWQITEFKHCE